MDEGTSSKEPSQEEHVASHEGREDDIPPQDNMAYERATPDVSNANYPYPSV